MATGEAKPNDACPLPLFAMELFATNVITADPFEVAGQLRY